MTTQQYVENIKAIFPDVKEPQIVRDLDTAQKLFAVETRMVEARGQLSSISSNAAWSLPGDFSSLTDVVLFDSNSKPKYLGDYNYDYEIEFEKFFIKSLTSTVLTGLNTEIDTAYIHYISTTTTLASRSTALEIDLHFRDALEHYVLGNYFGKYPVPVLVRGEQATIRDLNAAKFHLNEYERLKIKAKREVNSREPPRGVQNYQHAGAQVLPRRVNDTSQGSTTTTQVGALTDLYENYVAYTLTSSGTPAATETIAAIGYSTLSTVLSGDTFTLSSTAEFGNDTMIVSNNGNVTWSQNSSEIVFTLPSSWGTIALEIYERV